MITLKDVSKTHADNEDLRWTVVNGHLDVVKYIIERESNNGRL